MKSKLSLVDIEQKRFFNELLPMQLQTKVKNQKFGLSSKAHTSASEEHVTMRFMSTKTNQQQSDRYLLDADASLVYLPRLPSVVEDVQHNKVQLIKTLSAKYGVSDKVNHFLALTTRAEGPVITAIVNQFSLILEQLFNLIDSKSEQKVQTIIKEVKVEPEVKIQKIQNSQKLFQRCNELQIMNLQLEKKIEQLSEVIQNLQNQNKDSYAVQLQRSLDELQLTNKDISRRLFKYQEDENILLTAINNMKNSELRYQMQLKSIDEQLQSKDSSMKTMQLQLQSLQDDVKYYREHFYMQYEDLYSFKLRTQDQNRSVLKNIEKIQMLQKRIDEITVSRSKEIDAPYQSRIEGDTVKLQEVVKILDQDTTFQRYMMSSFQKNVQNYDQKLIDAFVDVRRLVVGKDDDAELQTLRYNYPTFMCFLDKRTIENEIQYLPQRALTLTFLAQVRAIMDGMFIEMQKPDHCSFQAYVFHWLSNYTIENHKVTVYGDHIKRITIEENIKTFYLDLQIPRLDKVWEIVQFRHFLNDIYVEEELYFYLQSRYYFFSNRHMLRRGPWMDTFDAHYSIVHYTNFIFASSVVQKYLTHFDEANISLIIKGLEERAVEGKKGRKLIQTGFVLQVLLELFIVDRRHRYKFLHFAFPPSPVTFKAFHKFAKGNFNEWTDAQVADLYRETFMISNGLPSLNSFFIAASRLFIGILKLPSLVKTPLVDSNKQILFHELNVDVMKVVDVIKQFKLSPLQEMLQNHAQEQLLKESMILQAYDLSLDPATQVQRMFSFLKKVKLLMNQDNLEFDLIHIVEDFRSIEKKLKTISIQENDQEIRISRFQKYARKKIQKMYLIFASVFNSRLKQ